MCARNLTDGGLEVCFYLLTDEELVTEKRTLYQGEQLQISCKIRNKGRRQEVYFQTGLSEAGLMIEGLRFHDGTYLVLKDQATNPLFLFACIEDEVSLVCDRVPIPEKKILSIGADFRNDIFYECCSFIDDREFLLRREGDALVLQRAKAQKDTDTGEHKEEGLYVNRKAVNNHVHLQKGDVVNLFGLEILVLKNYLVCFARFGMLRIAGRKDVSPFLPPNGQHEGLSGYQQMIHLSEQEPLKEEVVELAEIKAVPMKEELPLFLTIGPLFSMMFPTLMMMLVGRWFSAGGTGNFYAGTLIMTATSAGLSVFFSLANRRYQRKKWLRERNRAEKEYLNYLQNVSEYLTERQQKLQEHLLQSYPAAHEIVRNGLLLWNSSGIGESKKQLRLGTGSIPSPIFCKIPGKKKFGQMAPLEQERQALVERFRELKNVPVGISLLPGECSGFVGEEGMKLLSLLVIQVVANYGSQKWKVVYFFRENDREQRKLGGYLKWLPHIWREDQKGRFLAGNMQEAAGLIPYLMRQLKEGQTKKEGPVYLMIVADPKLIKGEALYAYLTEGQENSHCHALFAVSTKEELPSFSGQIIVAEKGKEEILSVGKEKVERRPFQPQECPMEDVEIYMRRLYSFRKESGDVMSVPEEVSFLQLYDAGKVQDLHCLSRWKENEEMKRIRVPLGIGEKGRRICLDVHEKFHGPHGLIAGTTGAGKSELLQTYLLSLAVSFGPESVNFFIIDYKGGGMGHTLCNLPHCAGVISNLSGNRIKRALLSIKSETVRRQYLFQKACVNHVDAYGKLYREQKVPEPVPHLILVVDEFAELKKEEPEFMQEIISMSQIGRSLGIHLLLATQKPAGTIDDKIWSNTRFRLCLRVADKQDSMDMLKRPEAAELTGAGRCYLQVGNNEIFEVFQSGYSSGAYEEAGPAETVFLVERTGERKRTESRSKENIPWQLEEVVKYIRETAAKAGYGDAKNLWMDELPETMLLEELEKQAEESGYVLGVYDDPFRQIQKLTYYEPEADGHICLCGMPTSGKSTFLQTFLWQLCEKNTPHEAGFLLICGKEPGLLPFLRMPHCIGYVMAAKEAECFFYHLKNLLKKRKEQMAQIAYLEKHKKEKKGLKPVFLCIDNYGAFREMTDDNYQHQIEKIAKEGASCGIYLVVTALGAGGGEIPPKLLESMKRTLSLEMSDPMRYPEVLRKYRIQTIPAGNIKGRGLCVENGEVFEMQFPVVFSPDEYERLVRIDDYVAVNEEKWKKTDRNKLADIFPRVPDKPVFEEMIQVWNQENLLSGKRKDKLPVGYLISSGRIWEISVKKHFPLLVSGEEGYGKTAVMDNLVRGLTDIGIEGMVFRTAEKEKRDLMEDIGIINSESPGFLAIYDLPDFVRKMEKTKKEVPERYQRMEEKVRKKELLLLAIHKSGQESALLGTFWYEVFSSSRGVLHMGGNTAGQRLTSFDDIPYSMQTKREKRGIAYFKEGSVGKTKRLLIPMKEEEREDDFD